MKKGWLAAALAAACAIASFSATAASAGTFGTIEAGKARYSTGRNIYDGKSATSYALTGGYRWAAADTLGIGIEGGYANLGAITLHKAGMGHTRYGKPTKYSHRGWLRSRAFVVGTNLKWNITRDWSLTGRTGAAWTRIREQGHTRTDFGSQTVNATVKRTSLYLGGGVGYAVTPNIDLSLRMTHYWAGATEGAKVAMTNYSGGVEFHF